MKAKGYFSAFDFRVATSDIAGAERPDERVVSEHFVALKREMSSSPLDALCKVYPTLKHPWMQAAFIVALNWLLSKKLHAQVSNEWIHEQVLSEFIDEVPEEFEEFLSDYCALLQGELEHFIGLGERWISTQSVCESLAPSNTEFAACWWMLGLAISNGVPILESIALVSASVRHPWLIAAMCFAHRGVCEGETLAQSIKQGFIALQLQRIEAARELELPSIETNSSERSGAAAALPPWFLPNFNSAMSYDFHMIDVGEETGELDRALFTLAEYRAPEGLFASQDRFWSADVDRVLLSLSMMIDAGLPILRCLRVIAEDPSLHTLRDEVQRISEEIEAGATISEAVAKTDRELNHPLIWHSLRVGECGGCLETVMARLARKK